MFYYYNTVGKLNGSSRMISPRLAEDMQLGNDTGRKKRNYGLHGVIVHSSAPIACKPI